MELRSINFACEELVTFSVEDCPGLLSRSVLALFGKERSPLLKTSCVHRGIDGVFEGDIVYKESSEILGFVVYSCGFRMYKDGKLFDIPVGDGIEVKAGSVKTLKTVCQLDCRTPVLFKYGLRTVGMQDFITKTSNGLLRVAGVDELVSPRNIKPVSGFAKQNGVADICEGDYAFGGQVQMDKFLYYVKRRNSERVLLENLARRKERWY